MGLPSKDLKKIKFKSPYTLGEEIANSITHGIATGLSIAGFTLLIVLAVLYGDVWQVVSFSIYGCTLILLYLVSTLYHSFPNPKVKQIFQSLDHAAIYLLIAGSYTPFLLVSLRGVWGWSLFAVIWILAACGVGFKLFFIHKFEKLSVVAYILMGWLGVLAGGEIFSHIPLGGIYWLVLGGLAYTVGVIFYVWQKMPYNHAIWHVFVMAGSLCHFFAILFYLSPSVSVV